MKGLWEGMWELKDIIIKATKKTTTTKKTEPTTVKVDFYTLNVVTECYKQQQNDTSTTKRRCGCLRPPQ